MFLGPWMKRRRSPKSNLFGDLKPTHIAIDFGGWIWQNRVLISKIQKVQPIGGQTDSMWQKAPCAQR